MSDAHRLRAEAFTGRLQPWARIPGCFSDRQIVASSVDHDGRLIALITDALPRAAVDRPYPARAVVVGSSGVTVDVELQPVDAEYPMIDALGDGFVVADARNRQQTATRRHNLRVVGPDGSTLTTFNVGDAIEHLLVDRFGEIWTGYFDEGELPVPGAAVPAAPAGLARWRPDGELAWRQRNDGLFWLDCYALNVGRDLTWAYPYPDFPLVTLDRTGVRGITPTPVRGARGLLVAGDIIAFLGDYTDVRYVDHRPPPGGQVTISLAQVHADRLATLTKRYLTMPDGSEPLSHPHQLICRDHRAYVRFADPHEWFVLKL